jgi:hypothetical protein
LIDINSGSSNRYDVSIKWFDTKMDPNDLRTQKLLSQLNDRVELFNVYYDCLNYLHECQETSLLILSGKCAAQCLREIRSLPSIDSIIIFCASPNKYRHLTDDTCNKILACIATEAELIQCVHKWIDLKCQTHFYTWNNQAENSQQLTRQTALFLANHLLPNSIDYEAYGKCKQEMLKLCRAYYAQRPSEFDHIREFELTYTSEDAIKWYTRDSFVHKIVNRALRSFDSIKLRAIAFYIRDLREQLYKWRFITSSKEIITVYHGLVMTKSDINRIQATPIGSLLSTNGFLSTSRKREIAMAFATKKQNTLGQPLHTVLLEINLGVDNSPIIFADIGHVSAFPEEDEILFDIETVLCLQNVNYDEENQFYIIKLTIAIQNDYYLIQQLLKLVRYQLDEQIDDGRQISLIGKLLGINNQFDEQLKKYDDHWQKFSLFRSAFNSLWHLNHEKYKQILEEHLPWLIKLWTNYIQRNNKIEKSNCSNKYDLIQYNEPSLARFEPVLFFCLNDELIQQERDNLSLIFDSQYRRFITKHLTLAQVEKNLDEFYLIFYISYELPSYMTDNLRIKFYEFKQFQENQDSTHKIKLMERLINRLLHDLGMFYSEQANNLSNEQENRTIATKLTAKGARCYQLLASENKKTIQRYKAIIANDV